MVNWDVRRLGASVGNVLKPDQMGEEKREEDLAFREFLTLALMSCMGNQRPVYPRVPVCILMCLSTGLVHSILDLLRDLI